VKEDSKQESADVAARPHCTEQRTIEQEVWLLAQPLDIGELQRAGVLLRRGDWYELVRPSDLPERVAVKIRDVRYEGGTVLVQLPCSAKASQVIAESMGIDWLGPKPS
jgi:hypothetical protein